MRADLADLRRDYSRAGLAEADLAPTWYEQFDRWLAEAQDLLEPNAVVLATATPAGVPSARTVLLKDVDERGFVVYTNLTSRKAGELLANPQVALVFPWLDLERQVTVTWRSRSSHGKTSDTRGLASSSPALRLVRLV